MKGTVLCVYFVVPQSAMTEEEKDSGFTVPEIEAEEKPPGQDKDSTVVEPEGEEKAACQCPVSKK